MSVGCTLHACPATHPCPWTFISVLRSGWFDSCDMGSMAYPPPWPRFSPACLQAFVLAGRHLSHRCLLFVLQKNASEPPAKMLLAAFKKKGKKQMHGRRRHRKRRLHQPRGHLTTRRQMPTASTNAYRRAGDSCMAGTLVFRGSLLEFSPTTLRRSGAGGREGALVSARCKGCSYDAECSANYTADAHTRLCANHRSLRKK